MTIGIVPYKHGMVNGQHLRSAFPMVASTIQEHPASREEELHPDHPRCLSVWTRPPVCLGVFDACQADLDGMERHAGLGGSAPLQGVRQLGDVVGGQQQHVQLGQFGVWRDRGQRRLVDRRSCFNTYIYICIHIYV